MKFVRIKSYYPDGRFTTCEHLYLGSDQVRAIERFKKEFPEHNDCIIVAEHYESDDPKHAEHFKVCLRCGCVH